MVGINSQIYSRTGGYQGVSFAIPIDVAMNVKDQLVATGRVERGRIGVTIQEVNQALADSFKLPRPRGALVSQVEKGGPADDGGPEARRRDPRGGRPRHRALERSAAARRGDQAGQAGDAHRLARQVRARRCASRSASSRTSPPSRCATRRADSGDGQARARRAPADRRRARAAAARSGRLVVEDADGPAAIAGVERGDVILAVNGAPVASIGEFRTAVDASGATVALLIQRDDAADLPAGADRLLMRRAAARDACGLPARRGGAGGARRRGRARARHRRFATATAARRWSWSRRAASSWARRGAAARARRRGGREPDVRRRDRRAPSRSAATR